jgi:hypothetical protein
LAAIGPVSSGSAWAAASAAVAKASQRFDAATEAAVAATDPTGSGDLASAITGLDLAKVGFEAAVAVARTVDETQGQVLDILA